jgi:hypothetical protein
MPSQDRRCRGRVSWLKSRPDSDVVERPHHRVAGDGAASDLMAYNLSYRQCPLPRPSCLGYAFRGTPCGHNLITRRHVGSRPRLLEFFCILGVRC